MGRCFNTTGSCDPQIHYMVDIQECLSEIKKLVDDGKYFTINRARQYGKTTTLKALEDYLCSDYQVVSLDFQMLSHEDFVDERSFVEAFSRELLETVGDMLPDRTKASMEKLAEGGTVSVKLAHLFVNLSHWCKEAGKPVVLMIDEVDSATNNQVFLDFLAQLRGVLYPSERTGHVPVRHSGWCL